ncbi:MAG: hypothetical protein JWP81_5169 [Ferruginibacter sp.]|nr:hypothetical protein [Ferruginibacter sp.]
MRKAAAFNQLHFIKIICFLTFVFQLNIVVSLPCTITAMGNNLTAQKSYIHK